MTRCAYPLAARLPRCEGSGAGLTPESTSTSPHRLSVPRWGRAASERLALLAEHRVNAPRRAPRQCRAPRPSTEPAAPTLAPHPTFLNPGSETSDVLQLADGRNACAEDPMCASVSVCVCVSVCVPVCVCVPACARRLNKVYKFINLRTPTK